MLCDSGNSNRGSVSTERGGMGREMGGSEKKKKKNSKTYSASDAVSCYGKKKQGSKLRRVGVGVILNRLFRKIILQE